MNTVSILRDACVDGKADLEQTISDIFDQALLALDDLNVRVKGKTMRTVASISGP